MTKDNVIKFGKAKKALARKAKENKAAENRIKFGRSKGEKRLQDSTQNKKEKNLDHHKIDK